MDREFIDFKQALALKELGFDEPCFGYYENGTFIFCYDSVQESELLLNCTTPTFRQAFRWFRKKYNIVSSVRTHFNEEFFYEIYVDVMNEITSNYYKTYEESELECIKKLIEICKNK